MLKFNNFIFFHLKKMFSQVKKFWFLLLCGIAFFGLPSFTTTANDNFGINLTSQSMIDGTSTFSIYDATNVKKNRAPWERTSVMRFIQDIVLGATTFIGTVVTVALIFSGFLYIFSTVDSSLKAKAKNGIKYSLIGMVIVMLSLIIIRLVQFLARGGS